MSSRFNAATSCGVVWNRFAASGWMHCVTMRSSGTGTPGSIERGAGGGDSMRLVSSSIAVSPLRDRCLLRSMS